MTMKNQIEKKNARYIGFADGRDYDEVENILSDLEKEIPEKIRGKMSRSILWLARHYVAMRDDFDAARLREKELEIKVAELQRENITLEYERKKYLNRLEHYREKIGYSSYQFEAYFSERGL